MPPISFKNQTVLYNRYHRKDYGRNEPISNMINLFNEVYSHIIYNFDLSNRGEC